MGPVRSLINLPSVALTEEGQNRVRESCQELGETWIIHTEVAQRTRIVRNATIALGDLEGKKTTKQKCWKFAEPAVHLYRSVR